MSKIPQSIRSIIAANIRACRLKAFPHRGGASQCAKEFNVAPQQWSLWETGARTPNYARLEKIAQFFNISVESLCIDHSLVKTSPAETVHMPNTPVDSPGSGDRTTTNSRNAAGKGSSMPGSAEDFYWLAHHLVNNLVDSGIHLHLHLTLGAPAGTSFSAVPPQSAASSGGATHHPFLGPNPEDALPGLARSDQ